MKKITKSQNKTKKNILNSLKGIIIDTSNSKIKKGSSEILNELRYGKCSC
jgi:hypothetical protein